MEDSSRSKDFIIEDQIKKERSGDGEGQVLVKLPSATKMEKSSAELDSATSSSSRHDQDEELESARVEMGEVREENQRLKMCLDQIMTNYRMLQMQLDTIVRQDGNKNTKSSTEMHQEIEETDLVSLTLGRFPIVGKTISENTMNSQKLIKRNDQQIKTQELAIGLDSNFDGSRSSDRINAHLPKGESPSSNSNQVFKKGEGEEYPWPPNKSLKTMRSGEDEVMQENPPKKARVCVRARCDTPTMNDGCQWRKYGQKTAKGNPCPRAYYRCTGAQSCPVRKQVQRCAEDMSILITTYEGTHNHPLSVSATAMASTTSAAVAMLLSGSSSTQFSPNPSATAAATTTQANVHGLNFYLSDSSKSKQFYLPNSSVSSSSPTHPTITIDLTSNPSSSSSAASSSSSSYNGRPFSSSYPPRYPFTNLDFGSSQPNLMSWTNGLLGYGNQLHYNRTQMETFDIGTYMQKTNNFPAAMRLPLLDPIAAATKAITSDPSFQSALAAALTSFIGNSASGSGAGENFLERFEKFPLGSSSQKGNGRGSSFIDSTPEKNSQHGNLTFLPSNSSPFSTSKSASTSPGDSRDHQTGR